MKPRRILHITRIHAGGVAVVVDSLVRGLDRKRYEPIVLFYTHEQSHIREKLSELDIKIIGLKPYSKKYGIASSKPKNRKNIGELIEAKFGKRACQYYLSIKEFFYFFLQEAPKIKFFMQTIRENRIDIVHTHSDLHKGKPECIAAWLTGIPCIIHNHGYPIFNCFDKFFLMFVDQFIHISSNVAEHHIANGTSPQKGNIIHNGVEISPYIRKYDTALVRRELSVKQDEILVGLIARIDWWKGQNYFIEAMGQVAKTIPNLKGLIIGEIYNDRNGRNRQYLNRLRSLVRSLKLNDKIIFTGFRSDIPRLISSLDVVVHASSEPEPFGLVIIETMAAGKPIIATAAGGVLDIIQDGVNGLLVPCKDSKAIAQAIIKIISNPEWARQIGLAARRRVAETFTIQHQVTAMQQLYDSVLDVPQH
jgi:glycosyltransferase involved in cell wall biosynthesis